jgi:hypothetical protein
VLNSSYIQKEEQIYDIYIQTAYANKESDEVVNAFLEILNYNQTNLEGETYNICLYSNKLFAKDKIYYDILKLILFYIETNH